MGLSTNIHAIHVVARVADAKSKSGNSAEVQKSEATFPQPATAAGAAVEGQVSYSNLTTATEGGSSSSR